MTTTVDHPAEPLDAGAPEPPARDRKSLILAVCCVAQFMVILDLSIVNVALPEIQSALRISAADLQWVVDAYAIIFAGFLMLAGRATDLFGQRRMFAVALLGFGVASFVGGVAGSSGMLIAARAVQGFFGAGMAAASLAIITATFAPGPERARAIALWGSMNGAGGAAGVLAGGVLTDALSWRWVLFINVPFGLAAGLVALRVVGERRTEQRRGFDLPGALLLTSGLLISTYGGVTAGSEGFDSADALVPIAVGSILLTLLPLVERRVKDPLIPPNALTRQLKGINAIVLLFSSSLFAMWFASSLYLQQVLALSPIETGLVFLPMTVMIFLVAKPAGRLTIQIGVKPVLGSGLVLLATGLLLMSRINDGGSALQYVMLPGLLVAVGIGLSVVSSTIAATQSAAPEMVGLTSSLVNTARQVGGGLGLAILLSVATQHTSGQIADGQPINASLTDGFSLAFLIGACLVAAAAVLTFVLLPSPQQAEQRARVPRLLAVLAGIAAVFLALDFGLPRSERTPIGRYVTKDTLAFVTQPDLHPPKVQLQLKTKAAESLKGYFMTGNFLDLTKAPIKGQSGPLMLDTDLQPVWFKPIDEDLVAGNLKTGTYRGKPVLSYWQGDVSATGEINTGEVVVVDQGYRQVASVKGQDGWVISLHEAVIDGDRLWVTANKNIAADLSDQGGVSHGVMVDSALQSYDIRTGKLLSSWDASDHIPRADSQTQPPPNGFPWDAYHINSLQLLDDGSAVVSMRNTSAIYRFDRASGKMIWQLGGKHSTFAQAKDARFEWQHDAIEQAPNEITLFDDHCCEITGAGEYLDATGPSRGLTLKLDPVTKTATKVSEYSHGSTFHSQYMGNMQVLDDTKVVVGWGQVPFISVFTPSGRLILDGAFPTPNQSYRTTLEPWVGKPMTPPVGAARAKGGKVTVYASWNGATELRRWRVVDMTSGTPTKLAEAAKQGFETELPVTGSARQFAVQALDASGKVIGTSKPFTTADG